MLTSTRSPGAVALQRPDFTLFATAKELAGAAGLVEAHAEA
ncbi:MAG TPA: hypothetical protein VII78_03320 [Myxococcota bacterium]|jgi:hypothetical protein